MNEPLLAKVSGYGSILGTVLWLTDAVVVLQGCAYVVAIVSGSLAIQKHMKSKSNNNDEN